MKTLFCCCLNEKLKSCCFFLFRLRNKKGLNISSDIIIFTVHECVFCVNNEYLAKEVLVKVAYISHTILMDPFKETSEFWGILLVWMFLDGGWWFMVFNVTFNNISVKSWQSVLLVEETGGPGENHQPVSSHWQTLWHNVVSRTPRLSGVRTHNISGDRHWLHR